MARFIAKSITKGRSYEEIFRTDIYTKYQDNVDTELINMGREDLIVTR